MIIGLHGESRSGKDSVASYLVNDYGFEQRNMADAIRSILYRLNPLLLTNEKAVRRLTDLVDSGDWDSVKAESRESVELMINLGQSCRDIIGETVWLDLVLKNRPEKLVIADIRQPNEYWRVKELGGAVWKVIRPGTEARGMDSLLKGCEFDAIIDNRGTLGDLRGLTGATMTTMLQKLP